MSDRIKGIRLQELYDYDRGTVHDIIDRAQGGPGIALPDYIASYQP